MPNRVIRDSVKTSRTLAELTDRAERLFHRLVLMADDFGRFEADLELVLAECFPRFIAQGWTTEHIRAEFGELVASGLVVEYSANEKRYAYFATWDKHQSRRAKHSKHPAPASTCSTSASTCSHMQADASTCEQMQAYALEDRGSRSENREARIEEGAAAPPASSAKSDPAKNEPPDDEYLATLDQLRSRLMRRDNKRASQLDPYIRTVLTRSGEYRGLPIRAVRHGLVTALEHLSSNGDVQHWDRYIRHVVLAEAQNVAAEARQEQETRTKAEAANDGDALAKLGVNVANIGR